MSKKAFTLAEALIAMAIIGVVAALTIPQLMKKYTEMVTVNRVKHTYSIFKEAIRLAIAENGDVDGWEISDGQNAQSAQQLYNYIKPYLKSVRSAGSFSTEEYPFSSVTTLDGTSLNLYNNTYYYKILLINGTLVWFRTTSEFCHSSDGGRTDVCGGFWIDINGKKSPNRIGVDIFHLFLVPEGIEAALPWNSPSRCDKNSIGWSCTRYILDHGNMDYLK